MRLGEVVATSEAVRATSARLGKVERLAELLGRLAPAEAAPAVAMLSGEPRQGPVGVGWAALKDPPAPAAEPSLDLAEVDAALDALAAASGPGSQAARRALLGGLMGRATAAEQRFLTALLLGDLRQGALEGVMADAVARAAGVPAAAVRRALMLRGSLPAVAAAALGGGREALAAIGLEVGRPIAPMLAGTAPDVAAALAKAGEAAVEWKLDGARIQVHRSGEQVGVFTRSLDDITARVPEVVEAALALPVRAAVLDGEAIALAPDGRPRPFQVTGGRVAGRLDVERLRREVPLTPFLFDVMHLDGEDLIDRPGAERAAALAEIAPAGLLVPRNASTDAAGAGEVLRDALARGHEGVMVKSLAAPYAAGRRGAGWLKVKPRHTLDLVVLAAEWGHGRRRGRLSNLHLGARGRDGGFVMLGKTFKGLTDAMLEWQTERLLALAVERDDWTVRVRPELVVEVAFDGVQTSPRYPGGVALRFARVLRHRPDKRAARGRHHRGRPRPAGRALAARRARAATAAPDRGRGGGGIDAEGDRAHQALGQGGPVDAGEPEHRARAAGRGVDGVLPVARAVPGVPAVGVQPVDLIVEGLGEEELAGVRDVAARVRGAGHPSPDVDLEVDVGRPALVPAGVDGVEHGHSARVGQLHAAQERARVALHAGVDALGVAVPHVHRRVGQRRAAVRVGHADAQPQRQPGPALGDPPPTRARGPGSRGPRSPRASGCTRPRRPSASRLRWPRRPAPRRRRPPRGRPRPGRGRRRRATGSGAWAGTARPSCPARDRSWRRL